MPTNPAPKKLVAFRMNPDLYQKIKALAKESQYAWPRRNMQTLLNEAVATYLKEQSIKKALATHPAGRR